MADDATPPGQALDRLTAVSRALTYAVSLDEVLDISVDTARELLDATRAVLMLQDDEGMLRIRAARGIDDETIERFREPLDETLITRLSGVFGPAAEDRFLGVPLVIRGRVTGLLAVLRQPSRDSDRDEWLLSALADQTSVALDAARSDDGPELRERVARLETQDERQQQALQIMGHDTRSPLNSLRGYVHLIREGHYGPVTDGQRTALERIDAITAHMDSLLTGALELSRLATGELSVDCQPTEVQPVLESARELVELKASEQDIEIRLDVDNGLTALAESDRLRQVLVQLLDNALKFTPEGSEVRIRASRDADDSDRVAIRVIDEGPGVEPAESEDIFEPYRRLDDSEGGFGLGLSIARAVTEVMGGKLGVEDDDSPGATFVVRLRAP
jgi:signal transduction histidine kinase